MHECGRCLGGIAQLQVLSVKVVLHVPVSVKVMLYIPWSTFTTESITVMGHTMTIASLVPQDYTHTMLLNSFTSPV